jgi:hypothetical protein
MESARMPTGDKMDCIDGKAILAVNRAGKGSKMTLEHIYRKFTGAGGRGTGHGPRWDLSIPTFVRALVDGELRQHRVEDILNKGERTVVKIRLKSGKTLRLTADHEVAHADGHWTAAGVLVPGDEILTNGKSVCKECGGDKDIVMYPYAKFVGYCRKCVYRIKRAQPNYKGRTIDKDGYARIAKQWGHPRANRHGQVYEHILFMEAHLGRLLVWPEQVHHRNGIRSDNRIENLELTDSSGHHRAHHKHLHMDGGTAGRGGAVKFIPTVDRVVSVRPDGTAHVYDLVMTEPDHNFVANGVIVGSRALSEGSYIG